MAFPQPSDFDPVGIPESHVYNNPNNNKKYIWNGSNWSVYYPPGSTNSEEQYAMSSVSDTEPVDSADGDLWYDTTDDNLQVRYNEEWISAAMNKEQSQTLDNLKSSLEYPLYIDGELEVVGELIESDKTFNRYQYSDDSYWPTQLDNSYKANDTTCRKLQFRFSVNHFNGHHNIEELEDVINSAIENRNKGLVDINFSYQRSGRPGYWYTPYVTELSYEYTRLYLTFSSGTYVGTDSDKEKLSIRLKIEVKDPIKDQIVLRHESRTETLIDPAKVVFREAAPAGSYYSTTYSYPEYYKLDANGKITTDSYALAYGYFIPEHFLSKYFYYYNDPHNRVIRKRFVRPSNPIHIVTSKSSYNKTVLPQDVSWITPEYDNKVMSGLKLDFGLEAQSSNAAYATMTLEGIFEYDVAYDNSTSSIEQSPDSDVLLYI